MPSPVTIYQIPAHKRSMIVCTAMKAGIFASGDRATIRSSNDFCGPDAPVAVFYGFDDRLRAIFRAYREVGLTVIYVDLGYWGRRVDGRYRGYHKLALNGRHPNSYFDRVTHDSSRAAKLGIKVRPWSTGGGHILLAGMGPKAAEVEGLMPYEWERATIAALKKVTDRPIIYRPKPSALGAMPLEGADFSPPSQEIEEALVGCWAVVAHHSNACVDGLIAGVPAFCSDGAALPMGLSDIGMIESPRYPDGRIDWVANLAWTQWTIAEMTAGLPWRHLKSEGLVP